LRIPLLLANERAIYHKVVFNFNISTPLDTR
jgi:hypothetical protein